MIVLRVSFLFAPATAIADCCWGLYLVRTLVGAGISLPFEPPLLFVDVDVCLG